MAGQVPRECRRSPRGTVPLFERRRAVGGAGHGLERGRHDVRIHADAPQDLAARRLGLDEADGLGVGAGARRVLVIVAHPDLDTAILAQRVDIARDRTVAGAGEG